MSSNNDDISQYDKVYSIMSGGSDDEFYSFDTPQISEDKITISTPFKKGYIIEEILEQRVEEYFKSDNETSQLEFQLIYGVLIKEFKTSELLWLKRTKEEAQNIIKDKIIMKYQQVVPAIMNKLTSLENTMKHNRAKRPDDLIEL